MVELRGTWGCPNVAKPAATVAIEASKGGLGFFISGRAHRYSGPLHALSLPVGAPLRVRWRPLPPVRVREQSQPLTTLRANLSSDAGTSKDALPEPHWHKRTLACANAVPKTLAKEHFLNIPESVLMRLARVRRLPITRRSPKGSGGRVANLEGRSVRKQSPRSQNSLGIRQKQCRGTLLRR